LIVTDSKPYTTQLQAGLGLVNETKTLLELWAPGMTANQLHQVALESGRFPNVTARRLRNIVVECFAPRYLVTGGAQAAHLKHLASVIWSPKNGHHKVYYFLTLWRLYEEVNTRPAVHR
jgi:hypothetical protein